MTPAVARRAVRTRSFADFAVLMISIWLLSITCLNAPGRPGPIDLSSMDAIALTKAAARGGSLLLLSLLLLRLHDTPRGHLALARLFPMGIYAAWTMVSTFWSPLKSSTFGHGLETVVFVMLAAATGILCADEEALSRLLLGWVLAAALISAALLVLNGPVILAGQRPVDYAQPNNQAAIAASGLIALTGARLLWGWRWTKRLSVPLGFVFIALVVAARSRSALMVTGVVLGLLCLRLRAGWFVTGILLVFGGLAAAAPFAPSVARLPQSVEAFLMRGQKIADAATVSGRTELWDIAVRSFFESPLFGHGYYMMTSTGAVRVWGSEHWQTAHNTYLHVLTGLGLLGFLFLIVGLVWVLRPLRYGLSERRPDWRAALLVATLVAWFLGMGCFELSFAGPVDPASVLFYLVLGIAAGQLRGGQ